MTRRLLWFDERELAGISLWWISRALTISLNLRTSLLRVKLLFWRLKLQVQSSEMQTDFRLKYQQDCIFYFKTTTYEWRTAGFCWLSFFFLHKKMLPLFFSAECSPDQTTQTPRRKYSVWSSLQDPDSSQVLCPTRQKFLDPSVVEPQVKELLLPAGQKTRLESSPWGLNWTGCVHLCSDLYTNNRPNAILRLIRTQKCARRLFWHHFWKKEFEHI